MGRLNEIQTRESQARLIALLSQGMSRRAACKALDIGYSTASLWATEENFSAALAAEVQRRQRLIEETLRAAADQQVQSEVAELAAELAAYKKAVIQVQILRLNTGRELSHKGLRRLKDLPDESLSASDATRLLQAADALIERGLTNWGESLAIDELLKQFGGGDEI